MTGPPPQHHLWHQVETHAAAIRQEKTHDPSISIYLTADTLIRQICIRMHVHAFEDLRVGPPHSFAPIRELLDLEHDLWEFVGMYVSLRAISTVHEAELEFIAKHSAPSFVALGLGNSFAMAPAVLYHFNLPATSTAVLPLTAKDVLSHLQDFRFQNQKFHDAGAFRGFLSKKLAVPRGTALGVHVQNMQRSLELMRRVQLEERKQLKDIENEFRREISNAVFQLTKEKFSAENREKAVAEAMLEPAKLEMPKGEQKANVAVKLATDILQQVTVLDAHLDKLIGRYSHRLPKDTSATISKQDLKLRAQICHKKHERSRSTVVTWVLCSIIAKSRVLLDAKRLSPEGQQAADNEEECLCCCVGKESCTCQCDCNCHAAGSDDDEDDNDGTSESGDAAKPGLPASAKPTVASVDLRERLGELHAVHPDYSTVQLLVALEKDLKESPSSSSSLLTRVAQLDKEDPIPALIASHNSHPPSTFSPDHMHALVYQCRLVQNEFQPEAVDTFQTFVRQALEVEAPDEPIMPSDLPIAAPFYSLFFSSPLVTSMSTVLALPQILELVESVPCLLDVETAVQWHPSNGHGPFVPFFLAHFPHIPLLQLPTRQCIKLQANATISMLQTTESAATVATLYVSIFVLSHGKCPWNELQTALDAAVLASKARPHFVLHVLQRIPAVFRPRLAPPLLKALAKAMPHAHQALFLSCDDDDAARLVLFHLAQSLQIPAWQDVHTKSNTPVAVTRLISDNANHDTTIPPTSMDAKADMKVVIPANVSAILDQDTTSDPASCLALVEDIRKHSFGIGLPVTDETQSFLRLQQNRLERALQRLSAELYSTSTHFVLELLQNADDNEYGPSIAPCAEFVVEKEAISFHCNERGFQAAHVRALCDVGASTKTAGMIGQKGIGFKSVFSISDRPEIHSNGYHIHFDATSHPDNVRYILPSWISNPPPEFHNQSGTWFHLPKRRAMTTAVDTMLDALEPSTLLFLNQLVSLKITNRVAHTQVEYVKKWISDDVVELHTNTQDVQRWFVRRKSVAIPASFDKSGMTRLDVAFPLSADPPLANQPVFAYLPLQTYGFKCILQADFELPSSREAVLDNAWNQFLLNEFPTLFLNVLTTLLPQHPHLIQMVPVDIAPPFHLMAQSICRQLQDLPIIQTTSGEFVAPRHVVDLVEVEPITDAMLWHACRKHFIHPKFASHLTPQLKRLLGILPWTATHVVEIAKSIVHHPAKLSLSWYAQFMDLLARMNPMAAQLRSLPLFPIQSTDHSSDSLPLFMLKSLDDHVFSPADESFALAVPFADELNLLHRDFIHLLQPKTTRFLSVLGIKRLNQHDVLQVHLLPLMQTKTSVDAHAKALDFCLHLHLEQPLSTTLLEAIRRTLRVQTTSNRLVSLDDAHVYLLPPDFSFPDFTGNVVQSTPQTFSFLHACGLSVFLSLSTPNTCPGLADLLQAITSAKDAALATALMTYLDRHWTIDHSTHYPSVVKLLQKASWLPCTTLATGDGNDDNVQLKRPRKTFLHVPAGVAAYFPSPSLLNRELATALSIPLELGVHDYLALLQNNAELHHDSVVACLLQLKALVADDPDSLAAIQTALSASPLLPVQDQKVRLQQTIWKQSAVCPSLLPLRPTYPKTLKSFFVDLGVPVKPTVPAVLAALGSLSALEDQLPLLQFLANQSMDVLPEGIEAIPCFKAVSGDMVSLAEKPFLVEQVPTWWSHLVPSQGSRIQLVHTSDPANAPLDGFFQFGTTLEQGVLDDAAYWNTFFEDVVDQCMATNDRSLFDPIKDLVCMLLDIWPPKELAIKYLPTQTHEFAPFSDVLATGSTAIHDSKALDLPVGYHDILVQWGLAKLDLATMVRYDNAQADTALHQRLIASMQLVPQYFSPSNDENTALDIDAEAMDLFLGSLQCWVVENLRLEHTVAGSTTPVVEPTMVALQDGQLYVTAPVNYVQVLAKVTSALWHPSLAAAIAQFLHAQTLPANFTTSLKRPLPLHRATPFPLAKRPRYAMSVHPHATIDVFRPNMLTDEAKFAIGRVGEQYVYELLRAEYPPGVVEWVNEVEETGSPYDVCIHHASGGTEFIEVKSTSTYDKVIFEMSVQELEYASQKGSQYSIYRAFAIKPHGPLPNSRVVRLRNPITLLRQKKLKLSVLMDESEL
ncbi:Aste57867_17311 [Aphanomyces stellatus]|uniref:Aste57867_17311 protein n=1 Tax=Aphanomyces stellatus TaxID=120398 RepID=A0A485L7J8_9STRA|nr:hypothetical protein As57867_017252 [Aphanomyces stellatus]VFT94067.1 Aste57867_17311 [Aphanomyces stellatus]